MMHGGGRNVALSFVLAGGTSGTNLWVNVGCWTQESQLPSSENEQEGMPWPCRPGAGAHSALLGLQSRVVHIVANLRRG